MQYRTFRVGLPDEYWAMFDAYCACVKASSSPDIAAYEGRFFESTLIAAMLKFVLLSTQHITAVGTVANIIKNATNNTDMRARIARLMRDRIAGSTGGKDEYRRRVSKRAAKE